MLGVLGYLLVVGVLLRAFHVSRHRDPKDLRPPAQVIDFTTRRRVG